MESLNQIDYSERIREIKTFDLGVKFHDSYVQPLLERLLNGEEIEDIVRGGLKEVTGEKPPMGITHWIAVLTNKRLLFIYVSPLKLENPFYKIYFEEIMDSSDKTKWFWGGGEFTVVTKSGTRYKFDGVSKKELMPFMKKLDLNIDMAKNDRLK